MIVPPISIHFGHTWLCLKIGYPKIPQLIIIFPWRMAMFHERFFRTFRHAQNRQKFSSNKCWCVHPHLYCLNLLLFFNVGEWFLPSQLTSVKNVKFTPRFRSWIPSLMPSSVHCISGSTLPSPNCWLGRCQGRWQFLRIEWGIIWLDGIWVSDCMSILYMDMILYIYIHTYTIT